MQLREMVTKHFFREGEEETDFEKEAKVTFLTEPSPYLLPWVDNCAFHGRSDGTPPPSLSLHAYSSLRALFI